jgi:hypothetical protein
MSVDRMEQVELRTRYMLDYNWRAMRRGGGLITPPSITPAVDKTITGPIVCQWIGFVTVPNSVECAVRYTVSYNRTVPR